MNKEEVKDVNEKIAKTTLDFFKYDMMLLSGNNDLCEYLIKQQKETGILDGITGVKDLPKTISALPDNDTQSQQVQSVSEDILTLLKDISFVTGVTKKQLSILKSEISEKIKQLKKECTDIRHAQEVLEGITEAANRQEYVSMINEKPELKKCLDSLQIEIPKNEDNDENPGEESSGDYEDLKNFLEESLKRAWEESDKRTAQFTAVFGEDGKVTSIDRLIDSIQSDITKPRNKDAHNQTDDNQIEHDVRNRAYDFKEHIKKWSFIYIEKGRPEKLDEFYRLAMALYRRFDSTAEFSFTIGGVECTNLSQLIEAMVANWNIGVELLKADQSIPDLIKRESEVLLPSYELLQSVVKAVKKKEQERKIEEITGAKRRREKSQGFDTAVYDDYKLWYDACMFKFIYGMKPEYLPICWRGNKWERREFVTKNIFPLMNQKKLSTAVQLVKKTGIDVMAEYGLFSEYFQQKAEAGSSCRYTVNEIRKIEDVIIKLYRGNDMQPEVPLYTFYENMIYLADAFDVKFRYRERTENRLIETKKELADIICKKIMAGDIDAAYSAIEDNSFSMLRGWLCSMEKSESWKDKVNEYFEWYLTIHNDAKLLEERKYGGLDYYSEANVFHNQYYPVTRLERKCLVCYRFLSLLLEESKDYMEPAQKISEYYVGKVGGYKEGYELYLQADSKGSGKIMSDLYMIIPFSPYRSPEQMETVENKDLSEEEAAWKWSKLVTDLNELREQDQEDFASLSEKTDFLRVVKKKIDNKLGERVQDGKFLLQKHYEGMEEDYGAVDKLLAKRICEHYIFVLRNIVDQTPVIMIDSKEKTGFFMLISQLKELKNARNQMKEFYDAFGRKKNELETFSSQAEPDNRFYIKAKEEALALWEELKKKEAEYAVSLITVRGKLAKKIAIFIVVLVVVMYIFSNLK